LNAVLIDFFVTACNVVDIPHVIYSMWKLLLEYVHYFREWREFRTDFHYLWTSTLVEGL